MVEWSRSLTTPPPPPFFPLQQAFSSTLLTRERRGQGFRRKNCSPGGITLGVNKWSLQHCWLSGIPPIDEGSCTPQGERPGRTHIRVLRYTLSCTLPHPKPERSRAPYTLTNSFRALSAYHATPVRPRSGWRCGFACEKVSRADPSTETFQGRKFFSRSTAGTEGM